MRSKLLKYGKTQAVPRIFFLLILLFTPPCFLLSPAALSSADALFRQHGQNSKAQPPKRRSFWDKLFGRNKQLDYDMRRQNRPDAAPRRARPAAPAAAPKSADARRALVIGDFTAAALADGLTRAERDNPDILVRSGANNDSGLAGDDWAAKVKELAAREKPNMIIVMLGVNDEPPESGEPDAAYQKRIDALTAALQKSGAAWFWVGLPPFKDAALNSSAMALNRLYARAAERAGGHFVSIAEGFVDDKGNFALSGYDVSGQPARLRTNDGINFTLAGRRKLAFYAMQAIDLLMSGAADENRPGGAANGSNGRFAPVNPFDIGVSAKPVLAGGGVFSPGGQQAAEENAQERKGRADDFRLAAPPAPQKPAP